MNFKKRRDILRLKQRYFFRLKRKALLDPKRKIFLDPQRKDLFRPNLRSFLSIKPIRNTLLIWDDEPEHQSEEEKQQNWIYWANFEPPREDIPLVKPKQSNDSSLQSANESNSEFNESNSESLSDNEMEDETRPEMFDEPKMVDNLIPEIVDLEPNLFKGLRLETLDAINPNKLYKLDLQKLNQTNLDSKVLDDINFKKSDENPYLKVVKDLGPETWLYQKNQEMEQAFYFKSINLKVVSPTTIKMWTLRRSFYTLEFLPGLIQPHLNDALSPDNGLSPAYLVGNAYKNSSQLWNPRAEGSLVDDYWKTKLRKELKSLSLEMRAFHQVVTSQTVDYKTLEPITNGLFCTRIFGKPVERGLNKRRRYQLGFIKLGIPCAHLWHLKARPNALSVLLNMKKKILKMLAYYKGVGAFPFAYLYNTFLQTATDTLFRNRHKNRHHCQQKTFWLNHTVGFNSLRNSLFDMFIPNWGFITFFGLEKEKKNSSKDGLFFVPNFIRREFRSEDDPSFEFSLVFQNLAWEEMATQETLGGILNQDPIFWSKPWVSFFSSHTGWRSCLCKSKGQNSGCVNNPTLRSGKNIKKMWQQRALMETTTKLNKILSLFQHQPGFFNEPTKLGTFLLFGIVFNTLQSGFDIQVNKSAVIITSCSRKFDPFIQTEVYSNYSPALKAFFNYVWSDEQKNKSYKKSYTKDLLRGYKSSWVPKNTDLKSISYKKEMTFSTFQQGLNDDDKLAQVRNDKQFFQWTRWIFYSQLIHWNSQLKQRDDFQSFVFLSNDDEKRIPSGFRWLSINLVPGFETLKEVEKVSYEVKQIPLVQKDQTATTFLPVSLYTRLLEITPQGQVKNLFLLPFLNRYTHIQQYTIESRWFDLLSQLRLIGPFNMETQKKPNPLGTLTFRTFLKQFFQLACKKNGLVALMKKSKSILLSSVMHSHGLNIVKSSNNEHLNQLNYEKQKCVYHFLNQLLLTKNSLFQESAKTKNGMAAFILKQRQMLEKIEATTFSSSTSLLNRLSDHPFCYFLFSSFFQPRTSLPLLNPFSLKEKVFFARYLQTFRGPCYQNYYNFISLSYKFEPTYQQKGDRKKTKIKQKRLKPSLIWKKLNKKRKNIWLNISFEATASYFEQQMDRSYRSSCLENYFHDRKDLHRNTLGVVPTRFVFQTSFRFIEEEWGDFFGYITPDTTVLEVLPDFYMPSYIERILLEEKRYDSDTTKSHRMYNRGGDVMREILRRYSQITQVLTYSCPEVEHNKRRRALNEPCLFSYDHEPVFHERNVFMDPERVTPPIYYKTKLTPGCGLFVQWLKREIQYADSTIYRFEQLLPSYPVKPLSIGKLNLSKWEIPVEARFKAYEDLRPEPYNVHHYFNRVAISSSQRFYHRQMYVSLVKLRRRRFKMIRRFKTLVPFLRKPQIRPEWMMIQILPVLPPDLRPILTFGDQMIVSDLTKLYQQVLYRNDRCFGFESEVSIFSARLLQEAVDSLMENGKGNAPAVLSSTTDQPLKSLSDVLKGKKGRFRQNLLGKRVDYSGRSVIVVGPKLSIYECGLPKQMALELFKPFVLRELYRKGFARHAFAAKKILNSKAPVVWELLRQIMENRPVLLNRAPTLHRLGMQAFRPKLVSGRAILLHPLVCSGYNADFDGDQMAVHIPLTMAACSEAWRLMWSRNNLLSPATGDPTLLPSQDMILGCYYLTSMDVIHRAQQLKRNLDLNGNNQQKLNTFTFQSIDQLLRLVQMQILDYHSVVWLRWPYDFEFEQKKQSCIEIQIDKNGNIIKIYRDYKIYDHVQFSRPIYFIKTTPGRALINQSIWDALT